MKWNDLVSQILTDVISNLISDAIKKIKKSDVKAFLEPYIQDVKSICLQLPSPSRGFNVMLDIVAYIVLAIFFIAGGFKYLELKLKDVTDVACYMGLCIFFLVGIFLQKGIIDRMKSSLTFTYLMVFTIFICSAVYFITI